ncbi:MAG: 40S ribosomal protein S19 [Candidatus Diapherotrites archaeon]|nr:40S ribosomal protein S19 [Candidatus Diapherotrites archaeon]
MGIHDVPAEYLIEETAKKLGEEIKQPEWMQFVKTGVHSERAPQRQDWFYVRMASILYRAFKWGNIGTESLRTYYGGRKNRGVKREHHYKASGKVIRVCVQNLEKAGYLEKAKTKGRKASVKGFQLLNAMSKITEKNLKEGIYAQKIKAKKAFDEKKKKEVHDTLKAQDRGHGKVSEDRKQQSQKSMKKKGSEQ